MFLTLFKKDFSNDVGAHNGGKSRKLMDPPGIKVYRLNMGDKRRYFVPVY
jgi:hypothetical protein